MESYSEDERNFQTPEYLKPKFNGLEGKYIHSTPLSQSNPYPVFHSMSSGFTGYKDILTNEKTTPLYIPLSDEGYSSVGSGSTPTGFSNNLPTSELINQYKDYGSVECIHNSINQKEKLEIVALELLNQARLIPNYSCHRHLHNRNNLGINEVNDKSQLSYYKELNDKYHSLLQSNIKYGNYNYPSMINQNNECINLSQQDLNCTKLLSSININNLQYQNNKQSFNDQLDYLKPFEKINKTIKNDNNIDTDQSVESRNQICNQILNQVRREMIRLIDNSMHQLETYLQNYHYKDWYNSSTILNYCNSMKSVQFDGIQDCDVTPLNLKFTKNNNDIELENVNNKQSNQNQSSEVEFIPNDIVSSEQESANSKCTIITSKESSTYSTRIKPLRYTTTTTNNKTRRLRIHQFNSQLFVDRNQTRKLNKLSPSCNKRRLNNDIEEFPNKIPHLDESLDLRIHQNDHEDNNNNNKTDLIISSDNHSSNCSQTRLKRSIINSQTKTATLSAAHLKKAKMMFMYSRYPTSSLLKSYFPEVCFNRGSTAQLVKWFSNFREFFYIQIEKFVRQQKATGLKKADDIRLSREHELIRSMETHFNKGDEIEYYMILTVNAIMYYRL
uniref:Prospero homeobox protein 2 n=2 Tax=Schistosoma haematobium TaxID=6185 RepID=A0A094ZI54_SCHHA